MKNLINDLGNESLAKAAFERVTDELRTLRTDELLHMSLDISGAVATVLGVLPEVKALRDEIVKELPSFKIERFDKLEDYALALSYAHARFLSATQKSDDFEPLVAQAGSMRERLLAEARSLIHHGVVNTAQLSQLKGAQGAKNIATDLMTLTSVMQEAWPAIQGKTPTTAEDLDIASRLGTRVLRTLGLREQGTAAVAEVTDLRLRAYTKLLIAYDDARRAIQYLRAEAGDADDIAPGLHAGRPGRRTQAQEPAQPPGVAANNPPGSPPAPNPSANGGGAAASGNAASVAANGPFLS